MALLGQDFLSLKDKIVFNKLPTLNILGIAQAYYEIVTLTAEPDFELTKYEKGEHKEYALADYVDFKDDYKIIYNIQLEEFGFEDDISGTLEYEVGEYKIDYSIDHLNLRSLRAYLKGRLEGDELAMGGEFMKAKAKLLVNGVKTADSQSVQLYQLVLGEGYLLELEHNFNMAFFSYFSAIDNYIDQFVEEYRMTLYTELSDFIKRLSLKDKLSIVFKYKCLTSDLNKLPIWSTVSSMFNDVVSLRNKIAHGQLSQPINKDELDLCFFCAVIIILCVGQSCRTYKDFKAVLLKD